MSNVKFYEKAEKEFSEAFDKFEISQRNGVVIVTVVSCTGLDKTFEMETDDDLQDALETAKEFIEEQEICLEDMFDEKYDYSWSGEE